MNPVLFSGVVRKAVVPLRNAGVLLKKAPGMCREFSSIVAHRAILKPITPYNISSQKILTPVIRRNFSSSGESFNWPVRTFLFFSLSSLGIVGGFYVISYSLRQSNIFMATMDLLNRCPEVTNIIGTKIERKGLVKGKMASGVADMHFMVKGTNGQMMINLTGKLREGSKTEYDLGTITAQNRTKEAETTVTLYKEGEPVVEFLERVKKEEQPATADSKDAASSTEKPAPKQKYGFFLDKPWYYRIGLAVGAGAVMGIILSLMIMSSRQAPKNSSAYQSLMVLLKENEIAKTVLGDNIKSMGKMIGKSEESWANFSVKMGGKKGNAMVNCQAFRQGDNWRFTVVSLDTAKGRVYLCK